MSSRYNLINFCNQNVMDIKDELLKSFILKRLEEFYYLKKKKVIMDEELEIIKNNKYPIFIEYNSYRVLIFLINYQSRNYCILVDQNIPNKIKMLIVKIRFNEELYNKGTIFDGEIVLNKYNKWELLIFDLKLYNGEIVNLNLKDKYQKINDILKNEYKVDYDMNIVNLKQKKYYDFVKLGEILKNEILNSNYLVIGLSFISEESYYLINFHNKIFTEQKNNNLDIKEKNNKVFEIKSTLMPDIYDLYDKNNIKIGIACISNLEISELCSNILENKESTIVECKYKQQFKKWEPIKEVGDKSLLSEI